MVKDKLSSPLYPVWIETDVLLDAWKKVMCPVGFHLWKIEPPPQSHKLYFTCAACGKVVEYLY